MRLLMLPARRSEELLVPQVAEGVRSHLARPVDS